MLSILKKTVHQKKTSIGANSFTAFSPLTYDVANLVEIWDFRNYVDPTIPALLDTPTNDITCINNPVVGALNALGTVIFDGISQFGNSVAPVVPQPYTIYMVLRQITSANGIICCDGVLGNTWAIGQDVSPDLLLSTDEDILFLNPDLALNTWGIITNVMTSPLAKLRLDLNTATTRFLGITGKDGINLGNNITSGVSFSNCEFAYIILRSAADSTAVQNLFINWLKTRFAI